jgi:hypothetical protein
MTGNPTSNDKTKFWTTYLLSLFFGIFAAHRFYNKSPKRLLMLLTLGGLGVWAFIDVVTILLGKFKDENGSPISNPSTGISWAVLIAFVIIFGSGGGGGGEGGGGSNVLIDGTTASVRITANYYNSKAIGTNIAETFWKTAQKYPEVQYIKVTVELTGARFKDSYGNALEGPYEIGPFDDNKMDELRRYASASAYANVAAEYYGYSVKQSQWGRLMPN